MRQVVVALASLPLMTGCLGDPPPDAATAPLEVVVGSAAQPGGSCLLNRDEVEAGLHEVIVIAEGGPATVRIRDEQGTVVYETATFPGTYGESTRTVQLSQGRHVVECVPTGGSVTEAVLRVVATG